MTTTSSVLTGDMLQAFAGRGADHDRDNTFFNQEFEDLKAAGYLVGPVPEELGGGGLSLLDSCMEQRKLAYHARLFS